MKVNKIEINMVTSDALESAKLYEKIFDFKIISTSDEGVALSEVRLEKNEVVIQILNENIDFGLIAPTIESTPSIWLNLIVNGIEDIVKRARENSSIIISEVAEHANAGMKNAVIKDMYNHIWVLNEKLSLTE